MDEYPPVVVIGASAIDTKGRASGRLTPGSSNHGRVQTNVGGVARNVAENLARLGVPTRLLSAVGDDTMGRQILEHGTDSGIDLSRVLVSKAHRTGAYISIVDAQGGRVYSLDDMDIVQELTPRWLQQQRQAFDDAGMIAVDANLPSATLKSLVALAQRRRIPICADPTSVELAPKLGTYLPHLHMVTPNVGEARSILGLEPDGDETPMRLAKALVERGVHLAIVTMGEEGLVYADQQGSGAIPAMRREVVDLTGSGDALTAAVVFGLLNNLPVDEAVRLGVSAATLTLQCKETVCPDLSLERLYDQLVI